MYFWDIDELIADLRRRPPNARHGFGYLVGVLLFALIPSANARDALMAMPALGALSVPLHLAVLVAANSLVSAAIVLWGAHASYRANGGEAGSDFVARFVAMGFVLGIRLLVLVGIPLVVAGSALSLLPILLLAPGESYAMEPLPGSAAVGTLVFQAIYFWRLAHHFRRLGPEPFGGTAPLLAAPPP